MDHDDVRAALVSDEAVPAEVRDHLARCDACVSFAKGYERVRRAAPLLAPAGPPPGIEDRLVTAVVAAPAPSVVPLAPRRSFGRRALIRVAVGVAATLVLAVAAVVLRTEGTETPQTALASAARRTEEARSAKVRVDGTTTFVLPVRNATARPDFASVPEELRARLEEHWRSLVQGFLAETAKRQRQLDELLDRVLPSGVPRPRIPPIPTPPPPVLPPSITTTVTLRADGDVAFGDRLRLNGTVGVEGQAAFDLVAGRDGVAVRAGGDRWAFASAKVGPWSAVVGGPDDLVRMLRNATEVTVAEGEYRFRVAAPDGTVLAGGAVVTDGRLTAVRLTASGRTGGIAGARWTTDLRVDISQPGAAVADEPVDPHDVRDRAPRPDDASRVIYPFGAGVRAAAD